MDRTSMRHTLTWKRHLEFPSCSVFQPVHPFHIFHVCRNKFEQCFTTSKRRLNQLHQRTEDHYVIRHQKGTSPSWLLNSPGPVGPAMMSQVSRQPGDKMPCPWASFRSVWKINFPFISFFSPCLSLFRRGRLCFYCFAFTFIDGLQGRHLWASRMSLPCVLTLGCCCHLCVYVCWWIRSGECWSFASLALCFRCFHQ